MLIGKSTGGWSGKISNCNYAHRSLRMAQAMQINNLAECLKRTVHMVFSMKCWSGAAARETEIAKVPVPKAVIAGLIRSNPSPRIHGCRVKPGMTWVDQEFPLPQAFQVQTEKNATPKSLYAQAAI